MGEIRNITIVSGKGGVGKTSITASLACKLKDRGIKLLTADADVDAPNLEILFQTDSKVQDNFKVKTTEKSRLLVDKCIHCKRCVDEEFCHFNAIQWNEKENIPIIDAISCEGCRACKYLCPEEAFEIKQVDSGTIKHLQSQYGFSVITGETILGAQTSGKLVTEMRNYAQKSAEEQNVDLLLIDGPPGIGCPVIAALADIDYAIVIIEPTLAALHDAQRVVNVIRNFETSFGVIINKSNMWDKTYDEIIQYLEENDIELLGEIPLDREWPHAIANGLPIVKYKPMGKTSFIFENIAEKIQTILK